MDETILRTIDEIRAAIPAVIVDVSSCGSCVTARNPATGLQVRLLLTMRYGDGATCRRELTARAAIRMLRDPA